MRLAQSLYLETLSLLLLYLAALVFVVFIAFNTTFGAGWDALLQSPFGEKVDTVGDALGNQLRSSPEKKWDEVLDLFGGLYHVKFSVFDIEGHQIAGAKIQLPEEVLGRFSFPMMAPRFLGRDGVPHFPFDGKAGPFAVHPSIGGVGPGTEFRAEGHQIFGLKTFQERMGRTYPHAFGNLKMTDHQKMLLTGKDDLLFSAERNPGPHRGPLDGAPPEMPDGPPPEMNGPPPPKMNAEPPRGVATSALPLMGGGMPSPMSMQIMTFPHSPIPAHGRFLVHTTKPDHYFFGTRVDLHGENYFRPGPSILIASAENIWQTGLLFDFKVLAMAGGAIAVLSVLFWLPFIYRITKALSDLTLATERIAEGKFDTRLETRRRDEIGRLSDAVNSMAERLNGFVVGQKRFLADISHELFSPLARLQVALEILDGSSTKDQKALIDDIREEVEEMNHLINELIAFSKAELKGRSRQLVSVDVDEMLYELVDRLSLKHRTELDLADGLSVTGDRLLLERSFSNVLRNSVRYAGEAGPITIKSVVAGNDVSIFIQDRGPGVPPDALKHLAEPFFRPEPSRSRESGGVGLGLAIVKSCIDACGGNVQVRNRQGGGLEVEFTLKLAPETEASASEASVPV